MAILEIPAPAQARKSTLDFWTFWTGQSISNLGSALTQFALPLLVYQLTHSALNLGIATAAAFLPYLLFGLVIGAWVDRLDRKRLMIVMDVGLALCVATLPVVYYLGLLSVWWIYGVSFVSTTLAICFNTAQFAVVPSLVDAKRLVTANGHVQASTSAATVLGPLLAGALLFVLPLPALLFLDAASFLVSAGTLSLIRTSFNTAPPRERTSVRADVAEGLHYLLHHPVLRLLALYLPLLNLLGSGVLSQIVVLATIRWHARSWQLSVLFAAAGCGAVLGALAVGPLRRRLAFHRVAFGTVALAGLLTVGVALAPWYGLAVGCWGVKAGLESLFNTAYLSLRQSLVPNALVGRVLGTSRVLSYSALPVGALLVGGLLSWLGAAQITLVYVALGLLLALLPVAFAWTALGRPEAAYAAASPRQPTQTTGIPDRTKPGRLDATAAHTHCSRCWCPLPLSARFCGHCGLAQPSGGTIDEH